MLNINFKVLNTITPDWVHNIHPQDGRSENTVTLGFMGELHYVALEKVESQGVQHHSSASAQAEADEDLEYEIAFEQTRKL